MPHLNVRIKNRSGLLYTSHDARTQSIKPASKHADLVLGGRPLYIHRNAPRSEYF